MLAGLVSMTEVNAGTVDLMDLLKLNAILDARDAAEHAAATAAKRK